MDSQRGPLSSWAYFCQGKTRLAVQEELTKRDDQLIQLKELLSKAVRERDEAQEKYQRLFLEKLLLHQRQKQHIAPLSGVSSIEDEPRRGIDSNNGFSSSDCKESIVSSPVLDPIQQPQLPPAPPQGPQAPVPRPPKSTPQATTKLVPKKPLPEKGKLLQAVMKAGPLLQTLLLVGPLPQWRHPPSPLESFEIPRVTIPSPPPPPQLLHQDSLTSINGCNTLNTCGKVNNGFSSSDCEENIVSSPVLDPIQQPQLPPAPPQGPQAPVPTPPKSMPQVTIELLPEKPLPLPQWRHPLQPLESFEIPRVTIPSPPPPPQLLHQDSLISINGYNTLNTCGKVNSVDILFNLWIKPSSISLLLIFGFEISVGFLRIWKLFWVYGFICYISLATLLGNMRVSNLKEMGDQLKAWIQALKHNQEEFRHDLQEIKMQLTKLMKRVKNLKATYSREFSSTPIYVSIKQPSC
ncbi:wiskott-Aldrich syndrome protein family member 2-like [Durio zibethinus]|uniref:Wiskott-Aldrich syndrome protein family member 2-like n=1 Tax=Durio zibethinus TaxID=66656 RepID=A0A6P5XJX7_DURZI|nr:wiskott-Aldrich syndrome protein family member 2-like [Durio zibethinus]